MGYTTPDVIINDVNSGAPSIDQSNASVGCMLGVAPAGKINELVKVSSWTEYVNTFANGLETPFLANQDLSFAVYGFYSNGGKDLYVGNIRKTNSVTESANAKKATATDETTGITLVAYAEGTPYNGVALTLTKGSDFTEGTYEVYDAKVSFGTSSATVKGVLADTVISALNADATINKWLVASGDTVTLSEATITLAGGLDGIDSLSDADFVKALSLLDDNEEVMLVGIPGRTSATVNTAITAYCDEHKLFPMLDAPSGSTVAEVKALRRTLASNGGEVAYPWGYITDPSRDDGSLRLVPTCGHLMGVYARFISKYGVFTAPAGTNATVKGFISLEKKLTDTEIGELNVAGVVSIVSKSRYGIIVWGARGLNDDKSMRYVTDVLINYTIKKDLYNGTLFGVFKPNDSKLWSDLTSVCQAYLENLRVQGALKGSSSEAYYVVCDDTINTDESINNGICNVQIGYAPVKPAEFIVISLAHQMQS